MQHECQCQVCYSCGVVVRRVWPRLPGYRWDRIASRFRCKGLGVSSRRGKGRQVVLYTYIIFLLTIHKGVLTVTAQCLTALHAVCRISAALPGFSRFLVNLRVDSAAISSSERSPSAISAWKSLLQSAPSPHYMSLQRCVYTHTLSHTHADTRAHFTRSVHTRKSVKCTEPSH